MKNITGCILKQMSPTVYQWKQYTPRIIIIIIIASIATLARATCQCTTVKPSSVLIPS